MYVAALHGLFVAEFGIEADHVRLAPVSLRNRLDLVIGMKFKMRENVVLRLDQSLRDVNVKQVCILWHALLKHVAQPVFSGLLRAGIIQA